MGGKMVGRYVHPARQKLEKLVGGSLEGKEKTYRTGRKRPSWMLRVPGWRQQSMGAPCWTLSEMPSSESRLRAGRDFWSRGLER